MSGEEVKEKREKKEEKERDVVEMLVEELRLLRMAIEAHARALYLLAAAGTGRYRYRGGGYYRGWGGKRGRKRYGYLKNT